MAYTFATLYGGVLGNDFDAVSYTAPAKQAIQDAVRDVARQIHLPLEESASAPAIVAGTAGYPLPADFLRLRSVIDSQNDIELQGVDATWIGLQKTVRNQPLYYALSGNTITLWPTPNAAYTIILSYVALPAIPVADADVVTVIPDEYQTMLIAFGRWRLFRMEDDFEAANYWHNEYLTELARMKGDLQRRDLGRLKRIPGPWRGFSGSRFGRP